MRKPTRPKLTPITGTPVPRNRVERAQHRAVAAEHDGEVDASTSAPPSRASRLVVDEQLDARLARDGREPRERRPDRLRLAVRDHGRAADRV